MTKKNLILIEAVVILICLTILLTVLFFNSVPFFKVIISVFAYLIIILTIATLFNKFVKRFFN